MSRRQTVLAVLAFAASLALASTAFAGAITPVKVLGGAADQFRPSSNGIHLTWSQWHRRRNDVFVRALDTPTQRKVNASGTEGVLGSFVQGTDEIVYQQFSRRRSDIYGFDVSTGTRTKLGGGISTRQWEWWPVASADHVLFLRDVFNDRGNYMKTQLVLADRAGSSVRKLISGYNARRMLIAPGYAGTGLVGWTRCGSETCTAFLYDVATRSRTELPLPSGKAQYAPFVDETAGEVYYVRSGLHCGQAVSIRRSPLADLSTAVTLAQLPRRIDTDWVMSVTTNPTTTDQDLYFGRYDCRREDTDVYALRGADLPTTPSAVTRAGGSGVPARSIGKILSGPGASPRHL